MLAELLMMAVSTPVPAPRLTCRLEIAREIAAGQPVTLRFVLRNEEREPLAVLAWNTPLEDMVPAALVVAAGGRVLRFDAPKVKRGDPEADEYVTVAPGAEVAGTVDLADAYDLQPGEHAVRFDGRLHDVAPPSAAPRPRARHRAVPLACGPATFVLR